MKHAVDFIHRFLQGNRVEPDEVLWAILVSAFVFASIHLVTMFLTRWGDRRVTGKALFFSLLLHFGLFMAVVTIPVPPGIPGGGPEDRIQAARTYGMLKGRSVLDPVHVSNAVLWLLSDDAMQVTGLAVPVDAGHMICPHYNPAPVD